jgi:hypothetical protein
MTCSSGAVRAPEFSDSERVAAGSVTIMPFDVPSEKKGWDHSTARSQMSDSVESILR